MTNLDFAIIIGEFLAVVVPISLGIIAIENIFSRRRIKRERSMYIGNVEVKPQTRIH